MVLTRHLVVKIWWSICIQDAVLHYQINPMRLTCFLYQIYLTGKADENDYLYVQNPEAH